MAIVRPLTSGYYGDTTNDHYSSGATGTVVAQYIPEIFSKNVLVQFYNESTSVQLCNTDYEGDIKGSGDSVVIRKDPTVTTNDYHIGETITWEVPEEASINMYIDQYKYNSFRIDSIDNLQSDIGLENRFQEACKESMKQTIDTEMFNYMVAGQSGTIASTDLTAPDELASTQYGATAGAVSGDIDLGTTFTTASGDNAISITTSTIHGILVDLNTVLFEARTSGNWFCMTPAIAAYLKLSDLKQADITGDGTGVIRTGLIGQVDGSDIYVTNNMPSATEDGGSGDDVVLHAILAGNSQYCSFASQMTESEVLPIPDSFGKYYRSLSVYGRKVVQPTAAALAVVRKG